MTEDIPAPLVEVLLPGAQSSLQDLGRRGYQSLGIAEAGAMDTYSLVLANRLLNNSDGAACLEITLMGPKLRFLRDVLFALAGADLSANLAGRLLLPGTVHEAKKGDVLAFGARRKGMRGYLAVPGGFYAPPVLGSLSTYIYAGFGGLQGRALIKGDRLSGRADPKPQLKLAELPAGLTLPADGPRLLRVIMGPHEERFSKAGIEAFLGGAYEVTSHSNRMGYRLKGSRIEHLDGPIVVSEATPLGAVQVPGGGQPVLLLRERGVTGGYTKIACIITPDIDLIGQTPFDCEIRFKAVDLAQAHQAERERWQAMNAWRPAAETKV